jgi:hypothetical protein
MFGLLDYGVHAFTREIHRIIHHPAAKSNPDDVRTPGLSPGLAFCAEADEAVSPVLCTGLADKGKLQSFVEEVNDMNMAQSSDLRLVLSSDQVAAVLQLRRRTITNRWSRRSARDQGRQRVARQPG